MGEDVEQSKRKEMKRDKVIPQEADDLSAPFDSDLSSLEKVEKNATTLFTNGLWV